MKELNNRLWYYKTYNSLINTRILRGLDKTKLDYYTEKHHILPRCMGGKDEDSNYVLLTAREHIIAHVLLCKCYPDNLKLLRSVQAMFMIISKGADDGDKCSRLLNSKVIAELREKALHSKKTAEHKRKISESQLGSKNHMFGKTISEVTRKKLSDKRKGKGKGKGNPMFGKKHSEESKLKNKIAHLGKVPTEESNRKRSKSMKVRYSKMTAEEKRQIYGKTSLKGEKNPMFGRKLPKEQVDKLAQLSRERSRAIKVGGRNF